MIVRLVDKDKISESIVDVTVTTLGNGTIELAGRKGNGSKWIITQLTKDGVLLPNKGGCGQLGISISDRYNQPLEK